MSGQRRERGGKDGNHCKEEVGEIRRNQAFLRGWTGEEWRGEIANTRTVSGGRLASANPEDGLLFEQADGRKKGRSVGEAESLSPTDRRCPFNTIRSPQPAVLVGM